jgi:hypothetical protein
MNILLSGASGLIGSALAATLRAAGHQVVALRRNRMEGHQPTPWWDPDRNLIDLDGAGSFDAVVHLAGESISQRWTPAAKERIRTSRVQGTRLLAEALARQRKPPAAFVCASAIGFYGNRGDTWLDEESVAGVGYLADVCREWESAVAPARACGLRVVPLRFGVVLSPAGGALAKMLPIFRLGLGGRLGHGRQYWSWIALGDAVAAIHRVLEDQRLDGPVNVVAPNPVTNADFTRALAVILHRPASMPVPGFALRLLMGEMADGALLASARVRPSQLARTGFRFAWPDLDSALRALLHAPSSR